MYISVYMSLSPSPYLYTYLSLWITRFRRRQTRLVSYAIPIALPLNPTSRRSASLKAT